MKIQGILQFQWDYCLNNIVTLIPLISNIHD
jgi:hypothetical protein